MMLKSVLKLKGCLRQFSTGPSWWIEKRMNMYKIFDHIDGIKGHVEPVPFEFKARDLSHESSQNLYAKWKTHFQIPPVASDEEDELLFDHFKINACLIHNGHWMGRGCGLYLNRFADYKKRLFIDSMPFTHWNVIPKENVDWEKAGAITPADNQLSCGCCFSFAVASCVEAIHQIRTGHLLNLSPQDLVDFDVFSHGCEGGHFLTAFDFVRKFGIQTKEDYPYRATLSITTRPRNPAVFIDGVGEVPPFDEYALRQAVTMQPVAVAIDADGLSDHLSENANGVFYGVGGEEKEPILDHDVTVVGYGQTSRGRNIGRSRIHGEK